MAIKKYRVPRTRDLGFGWKVYIKQVGPDIFKAFNCPGLPGIWMVDDKTIYIDKRISYQKKIEVYFHELIHAVADFEVRARGGI